MNISCQGSCKQGIFSCRYEFHAGMSHVGSHVKAALGCESTFWKTGVYFVSWPAEGKSNYMMINHYTQKISEGNLLENHQIWMGLTIAHFRFCYLLLSYVVVALPQPHPFIFPFYVFPMKNFYLISSWSLSRLYYRKICLETKVTTRSWIAQKLKKRSEFELVLWL